jgi:hypothetical protein
MAPPRTSIEPDDPLGTASITEQIKPGDTHQWFNLISQPDYFLTELVLPNGWATSTISCTYYDAFGTGDGEPSGIVGEKTVTLYDVDQGGELPNVTFAIPPTLPLPPGVTDPADLVPDCTITNRFEAIDFGDAPNGYPTTLNVDGPRHAITNTIYLGSVPPDPEPDGQPTPPANGDDLNDTSGTGAGNDEDGVAFSSPAGGGTNIITTVTVTHASDAELYAWLDTNADGVFESTERRTAAVNGSGTSTVSLAEWVVTAGAGTYYARFRVCPTGSVCNAPNGPAFGGEVEDVAFVYNPTAVTIGSIALAATSAEGFLADLNVDGMDSQALRALLSAWDPEAALAGGGREAILAALRAYLDPDGDGRVAVLRWDTLEQRGSVGFYVERRDGESAWGTVNERLLPALVPAPLGGEYLLADPRAHPGVAYQYRLIELEADGNTRHYGPYDLEMPQ